MFRASESRVFPPSWVTPGLTKFEEVRRAVAFSLGLPQPCRRCKALLSYLDQVAVAMGVLCTESDQELLEQEEVEHPATRQEGPEEELGAQVCVLCEVLVGLLPEPWRVMRALSQF